MNIEEILEDLYMIDPSLRKKEEELKEIIGKLADSKPESEPDADFRERLKKELLAKLEEKSGAGHLARVSPFKKVAIFRFAGITAAAALAVVLGLQFFNIKEDGLYPKQESISYQTGSIPEDSEADISTSDSDHDDRTQPIRDETAQSRPESETVEETPQQAPTPVKAERDKGEEQRSPIVAPSNQPASASVPAPVSESSVSPSVPRARMALEKTDSEDLFFFAEAEESSMEMGYLNGMDDLITEEAEPEIGMLSIESDFNTEEYDRIRENPFRITGSEPISTFSIDVDTASYANVRRFLTGGTLPYPDAVRIEELINYFTYDYPQPRSDAPFSFTSETAACPWNEENLLLQIGLQGERISKEELPPSNIVFLLDVSGSMSDANKLPLLKKSMGLLIETLDQDDRVSIVAYAGAAGLVLPPTPGNDSIKILGAMDNLEAGGSTAGGEGIELAYRTAAENFFPEGNNRVILATDGDFNVGASSRGELTRLIEEKREGGIFLTVLGLGMGNYKDSTMESLADTGNGNYAYIDTLSEARKVLVTELESTLYTIAKDVKIQIEFNPALVESYRLIGYENRMLETRDFDDDTKDAGEIGAGHSVTALYEIVPAGGVAGQGTELRYQETELSNTAFESGELGFIKFRYKAPDEDVSTLITSPISFGTSSFSQASENMRFAASVAEWGMVLRSSEHLPSRNLERIISTVRGALGQDPFGYRAEFLTLLYRTRDLIQ